MTRRGLQINLDEAWWEGPLPPPGSWVPVYRNGGPRDGDRIGTGWVAEDGGFDVRLGVDEKGERLR